MLKSGAGHVKTGLLNIRAVGGVFRMQNPALNVCKVDGLPLFGLPCRYILDTGVDLDAI
jgi:hypothetical protein